MADWFIARGPLCWGKADSIGVAMAKCRNAYPTMLKTHHGHARIEMDVFQVSEDSFVDEHGTINSNEAIILVRQVRYVGEQRRVKTLHEEVGKKADEVL